MCDRDDQADAWNVFKTGRIHQIKCHARRIQELTEIAHELRRSGVGTKEVLAKISEHAEEIKQYVAAEAKDD